MLIMQFTNKPPLKDDQRVTVTPSYGAIYTEFTYTLEYSDPEGDEMFEGYPELYISYFDKGGYQQIEGSPFIMESTDTNNVYRYTQSLPSKGNYRYFVIVKDWYGRGIWRTGFGPEVKTNFTVEGYVKDRAENAIEGVTITATEDDGYGLVTYTTDENGYYKITITTTNWIITPSKDRMMFEPSSKQYDNISQDEILNFTGIKPQVQMYTITGYVKDHLGKGLKGVVITAIPQGQTATYVTKKTITDENGYYEIKLEVGVWTIQASKQDVRFNPEKIEEISVAKSLRCPDFVEIVEYKLTGYIRDSLGKGIEGVLITAIPKGEITTYAQDKTIKTDKNGYYEMSLEMGKWTLNFSKQGMRFTPETRDLEINRVLSASDCIGVRSDIVYTNMRGVSIEEPVIREKEGKNNASIWYNIEETGKVKVRIYTIDGVKVWEEEKQSEKGLDYISWDGTNEQGEKVASGLYYVFIEGPGLKDKKKIVVIR